MNELLVWHRRVLAFEAEAAELLSTSDGAIQSRVYNASDALKRISELTFEQADALKQSIRCVEHNLYQAAFVMAWTAVADLILDISVSRLSEVKAVRTKWKFSDKVSLSEECGDFAIVEALKDSKIISKSEMKTLHGLLHRRNQCAHRSDIFPTANEALGFIDEVVVAVHFIFTKFP